jgi:hypothetical protein
VTPPVVCQISISWQTALFTAYLQANRSGRLMLFLAAHRMNVQIGLETALYRAEQRLLGQYDITNALRIFGG